MIDPVDGVTVGVEALIRRLTVDCLKIDRGFVRDVPEEPDDLGIVESVVRLAQAFNRSVIAEGVETPEHCAALIRLGCRFAQGYGIARPMLAAQLPLWVRTSGYLPRIA
jgi:EAL domain-containing protein (putative c-di-GMP-specific phosphodiesterase class I)